MLTIKVFRASFAINISWQISCHTCASLVNWMLWFVYSMFLFKYVTNDNELNASNFSVFLTEELSRAGKKTKRCQFIHLVQDYWHIHPQSQSWIQIQILTPFFSSIYILISIVITCSTTPLPAIMSHLLISAFSAYRWPLAVLRTCNSHHGQEGDFKIGVMIASPIRFQTLFWSSESTLTETCPAPALRRDVLKKMLFLAMPEQQRTWQKRQNEKRTEIFFLLLLKMSNQERTSSKMCLCTTFCAKAWSASRRPFTSWGSLSKAALVGTRRVWPSLSASSPT